MSPNEGGVIAIGGFNSDHIDVVECLSGEGTTEWRLLAPLPIPLSSRGGVYFKQRILVVGGATQGWVQTSNVLEFRPSTAGGIGQWITLKSKLPRPEYPTHITICENNLFLVSKFNCSKLSKKGLTPK